MALLLSLSPAASSRATGMVRAGGFAGWAPDLLLGRDLKGKVFGVVGPGRIGKAVARRARAFGMTVDRLRPLARATRTTPTTRRASRSTSCSAAPTSSRSTFR